jgi:hypothetical protein
MVAHRPHSVSWAEALGLKLQASKWATQQYKCNSAVLWVERPVYAQILGAEPVLDALIFKKLIGSKEQNEQTGIAEIPVQIVDQKGCEDSYRCQMKLFKRGDS